MTSWPNRRGLAATGCLVLLLLLLSVSVLAEQGTNPETADEESHGDGAEEHVEEAEPVQAILFPWFIECLGVVAFFLLSRYANWLPYTAVMFIIGMLIGVGSTLRGEVNELSISIEEFWIPIDSEVLLVVFLPGLIYKDASSLNTHLFGASFWQLLNFAFPMVLVGTALTACVAFYVFPYGWSFNLSMTMGAILSATDPVAVAALLDEVGAPPRLKTHISGESLLNDGSAIVFFTIFFDLFLLELGIPGVGEEYDGASGTAKFFRMSLGGVAIGLFFALGLVSLLSLLNHRLSREENVVQVAATITIAYLCYYCADVIWGTSGVIATVTLGITTTVMAVTKVNDWQLMQDFWSLVEHLLNTLLFALGGLVWGSIICNSDTRAGEFNSKDWGYLFLLYVLLTAIRFFIFSVNYPLTSRIGLGTCWPETIFQSYGGLRGAVGIALAIVVDNTVREATEEGSIYEQQTTKLFGFVGGIAFLTLVVNATFAGPLLRKLGLADVLPVRQRIIKLYERRWRTHMIDELVRLLAQERFSKVNFAVIRNHVSMIADMTKEEFLQAVELNRQTFGHRADFREPKVDNILPYLEDPKDAEDPPREARDHMDSVSTVANKVESTPSPTASPPEKLDSSMSTEELRGIFLAVVQGSYQRQIALGEIYNRELVANSLSESVECASVDVQKGKPLNDWEYLDIVELSLNKKIASLRGNKYLSCCWNAQVAHELGYEKMRINVERCLAFLDAHSHARNAFEQEIPVSTELSDDIQQVMKESQAECQKATDVLNSHSFDDVCAIVSHKCCNILLGNCARYIEKVTEKGLLKPTEAEPFLEEIQHELNAIDSCAEKEHPGELKLPDASSGQMTSTKVAEEEEEDAAATK